MARFDPKTYPDRLAFEANARQIRSDELARIFAAAVSLLVHPKGDLANRVARMAAATAARSPAETAR